MFFSTGEANRLLLTPNRGAIVRGGTNLHPDIPQVRAEHPPTSCSGARNAAPAPPTTTQSRRELACGGGKKLFGAGSIWA